MIQMLKLSGKDIKVVIITMVHKIKENSLEMNEKINFLSRETETILKGTF